MYKLMWASLTSFVVLTGNFVILFIALARVSCRSVQCCLYKWSVIEHLKLNGEIQQQLGPDMNSIYRLTSLHDGINRIAVHMQPLASEHKQVPSLDQTIIYGKDIDSVLAFLLMC